MATSATSVPRLIAMAAQAMRAGDPQRAASLSREAVVKDPRSVPGLRLLAGALARLGSIHEAMQHYERAVGIEPSNVGVRTEFGRLLRDEGRLADALDQFAEAARLEPDVPASAIEAAVLCEQLNDLDGAESWIDTALARDPESAAARILQVLVEFRRAATGGGAPEPSDVEAWADRTRSILPDASDPLTLSQGWSLLVDLEERMRNYDEAFEAMTEMNRSLHPIVRHAPEQRRAYLETIESMVDGFTGEMAERWRRDCPGDATPAPIFLVGFPRSGTTMTERALSAHPRVVPLEERPTLRDVKRRIAAMLRIRPGTRPTPDVLDALTPEQVGELRRVYWETVRLERHAEPLAGDAVILDKSPMRTVDLPFVNRVFPDAKVLFALRDPRDVCLSCYRQRLSVRLNAAFFLDLRETARLYKTVMEAWRATRDAYSFPWMEVRYEQTVEDFPGAMRALTDFLGLEWDEAILEFHSARRATWTVNQWSVRQKVNRRAVGRWKHYAPHMAPILATLAPLVEAFGYGQ